MIDQAKLEQCRIQGPIFRIVNKTPECGIDYGWQGPRQDQHATQNGSAVEFLIEQQAYQDTEQDFKTDGDQCELQRRRKRPSENSGSTASW